MDEPKKSKRLIIWNGGSNNNIGDHIRCVGDNQGLHEVNPAAAALEESNALALAIVPPGKLQAPFSAPDCCLMNSTANSMTSNSRNIVFISNVQVVPATRLQSV